jgi:hypothetical protein
MPSASCTTAHHPISGGHSVTHSHPSATSAPVGRTDATQPPRACHSGHRKPYSSAPISAASPRHGVLRAGTRRRVRTGSMGPIPATVWACGPTPIDHEAIWPAPILAKIVTSFSKPGARVVVLPSPTTAAQPLHTPTDITGATDHTADAEPDDHLGAAVAVIEDLDRTAPRCSTSSSTRPPADRPPARSGTIFSSPLTTPTGPAPARHRPAPWQRPPRGGRPTRHRRSDHHQPASGVQLRPRQRSRRTARRPSAPDGGILTVLTHSD